MNALEEARIGQVQCADDIIPHRLLLVVLALIDIGSTSGASSIENMCRLDLL
jgi:hypothetical protein